MADSLLREVDDEVRAERMARLWMRYRGHLFVLVAAILLASIGDALWQHYQNVRGGKWMQQLASARTLLDDGKAAEAAKGFAAVAAQTDGDLHAMARIWQARADASAGAKDEAVELLKQTAEGTPGLWGDIACLRLASLDAKEAACLADKKSSPLAAERAQWAAANAWAAGEHAQAIALLTQLVQADDTPPSIRDNAQRWLATMTEEKTK